MLEVYKRSSICFWQCDRSGLSTQTFMDKNTSQHQSYSLFQDIRNLLGYLSRRRRRQLGLLLALMVISSLSEMVSLGAIFPFLEALSNPTELLNNLQWQPLLSLLRIESSLQLVTLLALVFIATVILANSLRLLALNARVRLSAAIGGDLSCQIYKKTLQQPYQFHVVHNSSDLMQTVTGDTNLLTSSILTPLLTLITDTLLVIGLVGVLISIDGRIAISAAAILGATYGITYRVRRNLLNQNSKIIAQASERRIKAVQEGLGGIRDVLIANTQGFFYEVFRDAEQALKQANARNATVAQSPRYVVEAVAMCAIALLALTLGRDGDFSQAVPVLGSLTLGAKRLLPALQEIFFSLAKMQGSRAALDRALITLRRPIDPLLLMPAPAEPLFLKEELRLDHIWFRYSNEAEWVIQDLSLRIEAKTTVGFVGSTGSGKSTTADLILGLLQPQRGTIWVDNSPLEGERLRQWQRGIAHVPQAIFLTDATIRENIAFGVPKDQIDFDQVVRAARLAQIDGYIDQLPAGYDTYVGERGIRLSGGQRQRIGIARALYRQASVIVFDEATSALDNATEKEVMAAINGLSHHFTVILIAHRLSTVEKCDVIFELNRGRLVASGSYQDLRVVSPSFNSMAQSVK